MPDTQIINLTPENVVDYGFCYYKDINKHLELRNKIEWFKEYYPKGLSVIRSQNVHILKKVWWINLTGHFFYTITPMTTLGSPE